LQGIQVRFESCAKPDRSQTRATTAGTFNVLPMQAYAMYKPDVIGRTAGMVVTVKEK
jgi:uncharacterized protein YfaS (alpha-2-macroglobulin family)